MRKLLCIRYLDKLNKCHPFPTPIHVAGKEHHGFIRLSLLIANFPHSFQYHRTTSKTSQSAPWAPDSSTHLPIAHLHQNLCPSFIKPIIELIFFFLTPFSSSLFQSWTMVSSLHAWHKHDKRIGLNIISREKALFICLVYSYILSPPITVSGTERLTIKVLMSSNLQRQETGINCSPFISNFQVGWSLVEILPSQYLLIIFPWCFYDCLSWSLTFFPCRISGNS